MGNQFRRNILKGFSHAGQQKNKYMTEDTMQ